MIIFTPYARFSDVSRVICRLESQTGNYPSIYTTRRGHYCINTQHSRAIYRRKTA